MRKHPDYKLVLVLVSIAVVFGLYSFFTPLINEDVRFANIYRFYNGGSESFSLKALIDYATELRVNDNGRLANILSPVVSLMMPRWFFSALTGVAAAAMFWLIAKVSGIERRQRSMAVLCLWVFSVVLLPWRNWIIVNDYALNYVYSTVFILGFLLIIDRAATQRGLSGALFVGGIFVAAIAGWFHEGFSIPVCCGLGVYAMSRKFRMPAAWWVLTIIFAAAALLTAVAPGLFKRAAGESEPRTVAELARVFITSMPGFTLFAVAVIAMLFHRKGRTLLRSMDGEPRFIVAGVGALTAAVICICFRSDARAGWPAGIFSLVLLTYIVSKLDWRGFRRRGKVVFWSLYVLACVFFANLLYWQHFFLKQHEHIVELLEKSESGTIFYDLAPTRVADISTLKMATTAQWVYPLLYNALNDPDFNAEKLYAVVPADVTDRLVLYDVPEDAFAPGETSAFALYNYRLADGQTLNGVRTFLLKFISPVGDTLIYARPSVSLRADALETAVMR